MKKPIAILLFLFSLILLLSLTHVIISNKLSTAGMELGRLQDEMNKYNKENMLLAEKMLVSSSYTQIASSAAELGLTQESSQVFLSPLPLAVKR